MHINRICQREDTKNLHFFPPISRTFILFKPHKFIPNWNSTCITNTLFEISSLIYTTSVSYRKETFLYIAVSQLFFIKFEFIMEYQASSFQNPALKTPKKNLLIKKKRILKMSKKMFAIFMIAYNKFSKCGVAFMRVKCIKL